MGCLLIIQSTWRDQGQITDGTFVNGTSKNSTVRTHLHELVVVVFTVTAFDLTSLEMLKLRIIGFSYGSIMRSEIRCHEGQYLDPSFYLMKS